LDTLRSDVPEAGRARLLALTGENVNSFSVLTNFNLPLAIYHCTLTFAAEIEKRLSGRYFNPKNFL
jgi:hypothetical protein